MIPDFPQTFKHIPRHSLASRERAELAASGAAAAPPRSAHPGFDVADLPGAAAAPRLAFPRGHRLS